MIVGHCVRFLCFHFNKERFNTKISQITNAQKLDDVECHRRR